MPRRIQAPTDSRVGPDPRRATRPAARPGPLLPSVAMEIMGIRIPTILHDNVACRCDGCGEVIEGTPWRVNLLDAVTAEAPASWSERPALNPGPFQFHADPSHVRAWLRKRDILFCRRGQVREIMRPVVIPGDPPRWGACDGMHRDAHEFIPA